MFKLFISLLFCLCSVIFYPQGANDVEQANAWSLEQTQSSNNTDLDDNNADPSAVNTDHIIVVRPLQQHIITFHNPLKTNTIKQSVIRAPPYTVST